MSLPRLAVSLLLLPLLLSGVALHAQQGAEEAVMVTADPVPQPRQFTHGYIEQRLLVANRSLTATHPVYLEIAGYSYGDGLERVSRSFTLAPGSLRRVSLPRPALPFDGRTIQVRVAGRPAITLKAVECGLAGGYFRPLNGYNPYGDTLQANLLLGRDLDHDDFNKALSSFTGSLSRHGTRATSHVRRENFFELCRAESEVADWSADWLGYTCFDGVVLGAEEYRSLPSPVALALRRYVAAGGQLTLLGDAPPPVGATVAVLPRPAPGLSAWAVGFGTVSVAAAAKPQQLTTNQVEHLGARWLETARPWHERPSLSLAAGQMPLAGTARLPVGGLLLLLTLFTLLIGPANIILLARRKRRLWLFWTVPALSALACLLVIVCSLLAEGRHPILSLQALTLLDEEAHEAVSLGVAGFYHPLSSGKGLRTAADVEVTPLRDENSNARSGRVLDWSDDQHLAGGWTASRIPAYFLLRRTETRRERLRFTTRPDGTRCVLNGLGAPISQLWVADDQGRLLTVSNLAAGAQASLTPAAAAPRANAPPDALPRLLGAGKWFDLPQKCARAPHTLLRPGSYLALIEGASPFLDLASPGRLNRRATAVVIGTANSSE